MQVFAHHDQLELRSGDLMVHYSGFILKLFQSSFIMFLFLSVLAKVKDVRLKRASLNKNMSEK